MKKLVLANTLFSTIGLKTAASLIMEAVKM